MKYILQNEKVFEAYAKVDYCYYALQEMSKRLTATQSPLDRMIDNATGYSKAKYQEYKEETIELLEQVIKAKKVIGANYDNDKKALEAARKLNQ